MPRVTTLELLSRSENRCSLFQCPTCRKDMPLVNINRNHYPVCMDCKIYTHWGSNLLSGWRDQTQSDWDWAEALLDTFRYVEQVITRFDEEEEERAGPVEIHFRTLTPGFQEEHEE